MTKARWVLVLLAPSALACGRGTPLPPGSTRDAAVTADADARGDVVESEAADAAADAILPIDGRCPTNGFRSGDVCTCAPDFPTLCAASDVCTVLVDDPANCGACGHVCAPTSTCRLGVCGPASENLLPAAPGCGQMDLAIAGTTLYWTDQSRGVVKSVTLPGGVPKVVAPTELGATHATIGASRLFWIDITSSIPMTGMNGDPETRTTAVLRAAALPDGAPVTLVTETNDNGGIRGLAVSADGTTVFYSADTQVRAVPAAGGPARDVASLKLGGIPTALAVDGDLIAFPVDIDGFVDVVQMTAGQVVSCGNTDPMTGFPTDINCWRVARGQGSLLMNSVALVNGYAYWADDTQIERDADMGPPASTTVGSCPSCETVAAFVGGSDGLYVATDYEDPYQPSGPDTGLVERLAYEASSSAMPVALARGATRPRSIVLDPSRVYWSTEDCAIYSVAR
jgi:hypothetical protein